MVVIIEWEIQQHSWDILTIQGFSKKFDKWMPDSYGTFK